MRDRNHRMLALILALMLQPAAAYPCTTCCIVSGDQCALGRNYDWHLGNGLLVTNKRSVPKTALTFDRPAQWTSKYGSVTFNQYGREFPCGGMNEAGLVVEVLYLNETEYPPPDARPSLSTLQWIQYQLDTADSVQQVIDSDKHIRIRSVSGAKLHYFVVDKTGACATIEFLDGKMVHHMGDSLPVAVLANSTYKKSVTWLAEHAGFGGTNRVMPPAAGGSRFAWAANMVKNYDATGGKPIVDYTFNILDQVSQGGLTKWQVVYDAARLEIHFRTRAAQRTRSVCLKKFDLSDKTSVKILDVNANLAGDVTKDFVNYTRKENRQLVLNSFRETTMLKRMPTAIVELVAGYPDNCQLRIPLNLQLDENR